MHAQTQYTHECSCTHMHMYKDTHTHIHTYTHTYIHTHSHTRHARTTINLQLTHALAYNTYTHRQTDTQQAHTHTHTHTFVCLFPLISSSLSKSYPFCIPPTFGSKHRHSRSGARGRYNMRGTKAQVLDLGLCSIHTKFHSFILGTSGGNSG